jgi:hypothetical protein
VGGAGVRATRAVAATWALALLLTACGGDGDDAAAPAATTTTAASTSTPPPTDQGTSPPAPGNGDVPAPGTTFTGENISGGHAADLQEEVDEGHQPWRLDQSAVATAFASNRFGWTDVEIAVDDPHTLQVTDTATQHLVSLQMRQPVREGDTGIWVVDSGVWLG